MFLPDEVTGERNRSETEDDREHVDVFEASGQRLASPEGHQVLPPLGAYEVEEQIWQEINCLEEELRTCFCSRFNTAG